MKSLFVLVLSVFLFASSENEWKKEFDKNGVKIYTRNASGSSVKEYRGIVEVKAPIDKCVNHVQDLKKFSKIAYKTNYSEIIKKNSDAEWFMYCVVDFPWPYDDRDFVAKYNLYNLGEGKTKIKFYTVNAVLDKKPGLERMQGLSGSWLFESLSDNSTRITHESKAPADGFPSWLVNMFILDAPKHIMPKFRELAEK
jgi:hypothetical protein